MPDFLPVQSRCIIGLRRRPGTLDTICFGLDLLHALDCKIDSHHMPLMQMLPGKRGISLSFDQAQALLQNMDGLSSGLESKQEIDFDLSSRYKARQATALLLCNSFAIRDALEHSGKSLKACPQACSASPCQMSEGASFLC